MSGSPKSPKPKNTKRRTRGSGSIFKRRGKWHFQQTRSEDGKQNRYQSPGYATKLDCENALQNRKIAANREALTKATVATVVEAYIDNAILSRRAATTIQRYRGLAANFATIGLRRAEDLTSDAINGLYQHLRAEGLSETTIFHAHSLLLTACRWARRKRRIAIDPFAGADIDVPRRAPTNIRPLAVQDARTLLQHLHRSKLFGNAIQLALATGMRRGEVIGLRWSAVDIERRVLTVRESRYEIIGAHANKVPKGGRFRNIDLSNFAVAALSAQRSFQDSLRDAAGDAWQESGFVFSSELGQPVNPHGLSEAFRHVCKAAGLEGYTLHGLRHTAATWMLAGGMDVMSVQAVLGHSEAGTLLRFYAHAMDGRGRSAVDMIEQQLKGIDEEKSA